MNGFGTSAMLEIFQNGVQTVIHDTGIRKELKHVEEKVEIWKTTMNETRVCSRCRIEKPITEFNKNKNGLFGVGTTCRKCLHERYIENQDYNLNQKRQYYEENKEIVLKRNANYRETHKGSCIDCGKPIIGGNTRCRICNNKHMIQTPEWKANQKEGSLKSHNDPEWKKNHRESLRGSRNPSWKGGYSPLYQSIRNLSEMDEWRRNVFKKYDYKDWFSGCTGIIEAHHIKPFNKILRENNIKSVEDAINCKELWDIDNGVVMLKSSHKFYHECWGK